MTSTIRSSFLLLIAVALSGCVGQVRHVPVELHIPDRPVLTPVSGNDLQCLAPWVYSAVVERERGYKNWGLEMEAILKSNNRKAEGH